MIDFALLSDTFADEDKKEDPSSRTNYDERSSRVSKKKSRVMFEDDLEEVQSSRSKKHKDKKGEKQENFALDASRSHNVS